MVVRLRENLQAQGRHCTERSFVLALSALVQLPISAVAQTVQKGAGRKQVGICSHLARVKTWERPSDRARAVRDHRCSQRLLTDRLNMVPPTTTVE